MGVYIKGMEMPKDEYSYTEIQIWGDGKVCTREGIKLILGKSAIEVPDHGDLIDRDDLWKETTVFYKRREEDASMTGDRAIRVDWDDALDFIKSASVIIPAEKAEV